MWSHTGKVSTPLTRSVSITLDGWWDDDRPSFRPKGEETGPCDTRRHM